MNKVCQQRIELRLVHQEVDVGVGPKTAAGRKLQRERKRGVLGWTGVDEE